MYVGVMEEGWGGAEVGVIYDTVQVMVKVIDDGVEVGAEVGVMYQGVGDIRVCKGD